MKLVQNKEFSVSPVVTDALVLKHQGISSYRAEYAPRSYQLFMEYGL